MNNNWRVQHPFLLMFFHCYSGQGCAHISVFLNVLSVQYCVFELEIWNIPFAVYRNRITFRQQGLKLDSTSFPHHITKKSKIKSINQKILQNIRPYKTRKIKALNN
jgi:hypothetical protein